MLSVFTRFIDFLRGAGRVMIIRGFSSFAFGQHETALRCVALSYVVTSPYVALRHVASACRMLPLLRSINCTCKCHLQQSLDSLRRDPGISRIRIPVVLSVARASCFRGALLWTNVESGVPECSTQSQTSLAYFYFMVHINEARRLTRRKRV